MMDSYPRFFERPSYKWVVIAMLWFVCFLNYADRQAIFSVFPLLKSQMKLSDLQLGIVGSSFMWMYALFGPVAGLLCDRFPRKTLVLGALVFWSAITGATALAHSYPELVICRALGGLGEAFYFPAAMSLISDYHGLQTRSRAMSLHQSSVYAGSHLRIHGPVSRMAIELLSFRCSWRCRWCCDLGFPARAGERHVGRGA
jgi:MFS family permease